MYRLVASNVQSEEQVTTVYGIEAAYVDTPGEIICSFRDICADQAGVEKLIQKIRRNAVPPCVLCEIVEDFLCEKYGYFS